MSALPDDVMKAATNVATALLYPEVDDDGRAYLTQDHINIIASALVEARRVALEDAVRVAETDDELSGDLPPHVVEAMAAVGPVGNARSAVRATKASIAKRIRALQSEER